MGSPPNRWTATGDLERAQAGDIVSLSAGTYPGPLKLKAGVTLESDGSGEVIIQGPPMKGCLLVQTAAESGPTLVRNITLRAKRGAALAIGGNGEFVGSKLKVEVDAGVGIASEGPRKISLEQVTIRGTQALELLRQKPFPLLATATPVIGLLVSKVEQLDLQELQISAFAGFGALIHEVKQGSWTKGGVEQTVGVGLYVGGGELALTDVRLDGNLASRQQQALVPAALMLAGNAIVTTTRLGVMGNAGIGILHGPAVSFHTSPTIWNNERVGLRLHGGETTLRDASVERNRGAGLLLRGGGRLEMNSARVVGTRPLLVREGQGRQVKASFGDGLQLVMTKDKLTRLILRNVDFIDNARSGCLLHGADPGAGSRALHIEDVGIWGKGAWGLVVQAGMGHWTAWDYWAAKEMTEAKPPSSEMAVPAMVALPSVQGLSSGVINPDNGLIQDGTVHIKIGLNGLDPGRGP
jgi:hypothetical protein